LSLLHKQILVENTSKFIIKINKNYAQNVTVKNLYKLEYFYIKSVSIKPSDSI